MIASEENPEEGGSTANIESCAEDNEVLKGEDNDLANLELFLQIIDPLLMT
jgi:hypothetical protein